MSDVKDQIDEMLKMYESPGDTSATDAPSTDVPEVVEQVEQVATENPSTEQPSTDAPTTDTPYVDNTSSDELARLRAEQEELKSKLNSILSKNQPEEVKEVIEEINFIEDEDIEDIVNDPKAFNKLLNKVFLKGYELSKKEVVKTAHDIRKELPATIKTNIVTIEHLRRASEKFYKENVDLQPFKKVVSTIFEEVSGDHPDWEYDKLLKQVEVETRKRLNLTKSAKPTTDKKKEVPSLPSRRNQQRTNVTEKKVDPLLSDIDAMNEVLYRR